MSPVACPRCRATHFEVQITTHGTDFDVEVDGRERFAIDRQIVEIPDTVEVEVICRNCGHVRFAQATEWEWA